MALWGKTDKVANRPKFIKADASGEVIEGPAKGKKLVFIDEVEASLPDNKEKGISGAGWYLIQEKGTRVIAELVVAIADAPREVEGVIHDDSDAAEGDLGLVNDE